MIKFFTMLLTGLCLSSAAYSLSLSERANCIDMDYRSLYLNSEVMHGLSILGFNGGANYTYAGEAARHMVESILADSANCNEAEDAVIAFYTRIGMDSALAYKSYIEGEIDEAEYREIVWQSFYSSID